jgi:hypothetical protein
MFFDKGTGAEVFKLHFTIRTTSTPPIIVNLFHFSANSIMQLDATPHATTRATIKKISRAASYWPLAARATCT